MKVLKYVAHPAVLHDAPSQSSGGDG